MCMILFSTEAFLVYNFCFLNLIPYYNCFDSKGVMRECSQVETCLPEFNKNLLHSSPPYKNGFMTDNDKQTVLKNWMQDLDLRCAQKWIIGLFGSIFFIGNVIGSSLLSEYGDSIGRIALI